MCHPHSYDVFVSVVFICYVLVLLLLDFANNVTNLPVVSVIQRSLAATLYFLQRVRIARIADRCNSQSDSVCLSLLPSHSGVLSRRMKKRSRGFQRHVGQSF